MRAKLQALKAGTTCNGAGLDAGVVMLPVQFQTSSTSTASSTSAHERKTPKGQKPRAVCFSISFHIGDEAYQTLSSTPCSTTRSTTSTRTTCPARTRGGQSTPSCVSCCATTTYKPRPRATGVPGRQLRDTGECRRDGTWTMDA